MMTKGRFMNFMTKKIALFFILVVSLAAQQSTDYLIIDAPIGTKSATAVLQVKWAGISRGSTYPAPDSGIIYFDRAPGGGKLDNYRYKVTSYYTDTSISTADSIQNNIYYPPTVQNPVASRGSKFRAADQPNMGFGVFYCVVALPLANDTLVSNEFQLMIESPDPVDWIAPSGTITSVTPAFQWKTNSGVPYYHIILSDDEIKVDSSSGDINLQGLSIIWQAITPSTQIIYGAPDPSNTITATPPPLSPGQKYTWVVLNNYGNHPAFSSTKVKLPPGEFTIQGKTLKKPVCTFPSDTTLNLNTSPKITFKWRNLDKDANTYKLYIYVGSDFEGINAQLVVYETEVVASGRDGENETDSVVIDAASVLTSNKYVWRMIAVNDEGAGTVGDTVGFNYDAPIGSMRIYTKEQIVIGSGDSLDTVVNPVGLVQLKVEVLEGSLEAPLLFYTDNNGYLDRERPKGTYRVTAIKNEFEMQSKTIVVKEGEKTTETFFLERPDATVFGKVIDEAGKGINLATVYGISDRGDTVSTKSDALGSFILNCYSADWRIGVDMTGYKSALPKKITVASAENYNFGTVALKKNPYTLSGVVKNSAGSALLGVRIRVYKEGVQMSEVPSTPQNGTFSFTMPAGTYTLLAEKTGFTTYNKAIDILSSKSVTITLEPGAALVTGYVYGNAWVGEKNVVAPITNARITFIREDGTDTVSVVSGATYGDFKASLTGDKTYTMTSSADGYVATHGPITLTTVPKTTMSMFDTLQGLGMVSGNVMLSSNAAAVSGVTVNILTASDGTIIATGKTTVNGTFEITKVPDGSYTFTAAKDGLVLDSIGGSDTITFSEGKSSVTTVRIYLEPGNKTLRWFCADVQNGSATVKIQSPLVKSLSLNDSIGNAGPGSYILTVDAKADSFIDLSRHTFFVYDTETVHIDTLRLDVIHISPDTVLQTDGKIELSLHAVRTLDSVLLYYKDAVATTYRTIADTTSDSGYTFSFVPPRDGSVMVYYFKAYRKGEVYGYDKETYTVYIAPDMDMLTRYEIVPSSDQQFVFPSGYESVFEVKGYVSSSFIEAPHFDETAVSWTLRNAQGCTIKSGSGRTATVTTGSVKTSDDVVLKVTIDKNKMSLAPGLGESDSVLFTVSGSEIKSIVVNRIDAANPNPISTSSTDKAEFSAVGIDSAGDDVDLYPKWTISPADAGTISTGGVFRPARNFAGVVRVIAAAGKATDEYRLHENSNPGLTVRFMIVKKSSPDTASSKTGCSVIFPPDVVDASDIGLLEITTSPLKNQFKRGSGLLRTIDSTAFELQQLENITLNTGTDSIRLALTIPENMQEGAKTGSRKISIAQWDEDSLLWKKLDGTKIEKDGKTATVALTHFSRYSIVYEPSNNLLLDVAPNPFSPYITPHYNPFNENDRVVQHPGVCFKVQADVEEARTEMKLHIYSLLGDLVWSMVVQNADNLPYFIWWDGRTVGRDLQPAGTEHVITPRGDKMCRNGRYFLVLTAKVKGKERKIMKHLVLMK